MANEQVNFSNKLADRILQDARAAADQTLSQAQEQVASILAEAEKERRMAAGAAAQTRDNAVRSVLDGCRTRASLEGRKHLLARKREVIDRVFDAAYARLLALPDADKSALYARILDREAVDGDTVVPAESDRALLKETLSGIAGKKLVLSERSADIDGGFLILGGVYEKNCSMRSILSDVRDAEETAVAKLLFD